MKLHTCAHLLSLSALLALGCHSPVDEAGSTVPGTCEATPPVVAPQKTDILFVIDNSGSMQEEQQGIATELPAFLAALKEGSGVAQDFRVGVITTSVYQRLLLPDGTDSTRSFPDQEGRLQPVKDEAGQPTAERFIEGTDPLLLDKFQRLVNQGTSGSGQETPFEAVRLAVASPLATQPLAEGGNGGFLRDGARLLVVVVSDEEDCSSTVRPPPVTLTLDPSVDACTAQGDKLTPVSTYYQYFQALHDSRGASREVLWATIGPVALTDKRAELTTETVGGTTYVRNVDCPTSYGPGYRQSDMAQAFDATRANLDSICKSSYQRTLLDIADMATVAQSVDVVNLPDPRLAVVYVTRADGSVQTCTVANGDIRYAPSGEDRSARLFFLGPCLRRVGDTKVEVKVLCAG
ncbi:MULTISPECIES: VWA domain-containing protein [Corallococcus]|uniref:VWA domain-containing protein n=1 Tax=Corallococcus TaxID=83461 RepID=UPI00117CB8FF|nr:MULTISPECIES: VWA domain-containing protein [Corallococcus]NBD14000.1 VWA domain-containing protein [Corallococcus silvisoli]TSC26807.1 VWA domain-containing protein [Corallococcus sp. Z5C101001]